MSEFTAEQLANGVMVGFTGKRGNAWWNRAGALVMGDGYTGHYADAIPVADIENRLFNWAPAIAPVFVQTALGMMPIDGKIAVTRGVDGPVLGIHGDGYVAHDIRQELLYNLDEVVGANGLGYANAGLLAGGAQAYVQIELPENIATSDGSLEVRPFILGATSFDGSLATTFKLGVTNVVCDNTFAMFMGEAGKTYRRKHTRNSEFSLSTARQALDLLDDTATKFIAGVERLLTVDVSDVSWQKFVEAHAPIDKDSTTRSIALAENKRAALTGLWRTDTRVAPWAGTAWGVVQAVNTFNEHLSIVRNVNRYERKMTRAVKGEIGTADTLTLETLGKVLGRGDLLSV